jgi:tRNA(Phe) wybutosine-synthesizing methylase Tyw3
MTDAQIRSAKQSVRLRKLSNSCGGKLKIIASIEEPELIAKILSHLECTASRPLRILR